MARANCGIHGTGVAFHKGECLDCYFGTTRERCPACKRPVRGKCQVCDRCEFHGPHKSRTCPKCDATRAMQSNAINKVKDWVGTAIALGIIVTVISGMLLVASYYEVPRALAAIYMHNGGAPLWVVTVILLPLTGVLLVLAVLYWAWMWLCKR